MFSCCRCTNPKKGEKISKKGKTQLSATATTDNDETREDENNENDKSDNKNEISTTATCDDDSEMKKSSNNERITIAPSTSPHHHYHSHHQQQERRLNQAKDNESPDKKNPPPAPLGKNSITSSNAPSKETIQPLQEDEEGEEEEEIQSRSGSSNVTVEETNLVNNSKGKSKLNSATSSDNDVLSDNDILSDSKEPVVPNDGTIAAAAAVSAAAATNNIQQDNQINQSTKCLPSSSSPQSQSNQRDEVKSNDTTITTPNGDLPKSCISRRSSSKSSIRKKVNINDSTEVIPSSELASIDDDEVFSDSIPPKLPRGDMCAPYIAKPGSFPLPEWFNNDDSEHGGVLEPPVTPVGRDELELKRHRLYSELLMAAQAAVEHRVRFNPLGPDIATTEDCDPDLKPSATAELENLINRLEKLVERLERSISARELEIANRTFDTVVETKRRSFDLEAADLPPLPEPAKKNKVTTPVANTSLKTATNNNNISDNNHNNYSDSSTSNSNGFKDTLDQRIERLETSLNHINENFKRDSSETEGSLENIPTVLDDYLIIEGAVIEEVTSITEEDEEQQQFPTPPPPISEPSTSISSVVNVADNNANMSVPGYQDIVYGPLAQYINLSNKIGGDVAQHAQLVKNAFEAQLQYVTLATQIAQPPQGRQMEFLKPTSDQIQQIQNFREKNRGSPFFNHLSAISESIPALGWVCISPTPGPHVKEMNDAGQFYTNRVLKDWKDKNPVHVEWARAWIQTLTDLQKYIKQYHTTGLVWSGKGAAPPPPPPGAAGCPPPPPPPVMAFDNLSLGAGAGGVNDDRSALFAEINQGEGITRNLKKVTADMQTHKNATLRTGPAPFKTPQPFGQQVVGGVSQQINKPPVFARDGKKWLIEYQKGNQSLLVENAEMNNVVYMYRSQDSTLTIKGKVNSVVMDSCKKCSVLFDSVVSSVEFVNCQSVQMQVLNKVPTISIDKTDGCQMYLSKDSLDVEIISSKSSEMNVLIPTNTGDYVEQPVPEQFKTTIKGKSLQTICVESLG